MKLAVLADIHGNLPALEAVVADARARGVSGWLAAGDMAGGPQPSEVIHLLDELGAVMIRGNQEGYALSLADGTAPQAWRTARQWEFVRAASALLDSRAMAIIARLPDQRRVEIPQQAAIRMVHGSPRDPIELIFPDRHPGQLEAALELVREPVMVCGHTHESWAKRLNGQLALNPGSVGAPLGGDLRAEYAVISGSPEGWVVEPVRVSYDLDAVRRAFTESGLLAAGGPLARAALLSVELAQDVFVDFVQHSFHVAEAANCPDRQAVPDEIWERAEATYDWPRSARGHLRYGE
jgi:putative phosphoesterase